MKKTFLTALSLILAASVLNGQSMNYSRINVDPEGAAKAYSSISGSNSLSFFNNASVSPFSEEEISAGLTYLSWGEPSTMRFGASTSLKLGNSLTVGLGGIFGKGSAYDIITESGAAKGSFSPNDMKLGLGLAYRFIDKASAGLTICYLNEAISDNKSYNAISADLTLAGQITEDILVSGGLKSIGTKVKSEDGKLHSLPTSIYIGGLYKKEVGQNDRISANLDADVFLKDGLSAGLGAEYLWNDMLAVRAGYRYGGNSVMPSSLSAGLGARFKMVKCDFAYIIGMGPLKSNNILAGISVRF